MSLRPETSLDVLYGELVTVPADVGLQLIGRGIRQRDLGEVKELRNIRAARGHLQLDLPEIKGFEDFPLRIDFVVSRFDADVERIGMFGIEGEQRATGDVQRKGIIIDSASRLDMQRMRVLHRRVFIGLDGALDLQSAWIVEERNRPRIDDELADRRQVQGLCGLGGSRWSARCWCPSSWRARRSPGANKDPAGRLRSAAGQGVHEAVR